MISDFIDRIILGHKSQYHMATTEREWNICIYIANTHSSSPSRVTWSHYTRYFAIIIVRLWLFGCPIGF
jgi:outer membrane phospholipase A